MPRIVLNSGAEACLPHHLYVKIGSLCYSLSLYQLVLAFKILHTLIKLFLYIEAGLIYLLLRNYIVGCRENHRMLKRALYLAGQHINLHYPIYLITEKLNPDCCIIGICRKYIKHITVHSEGASVKIHIIPGVL